MAIIPKSMLGAAVLITSAVSPEGKISAGSGFMYGVKVTDQPEGRMNVERVVVVTCAHVADDAKGMSPDDSIGIWWNRKDGGKTRIPYEADLWVAHPAWEAGSRRAEHDVA